ncbi:MAG TPA: response regulator [Verrucomicrobiae bacterium]|nr:response regulator [Verrucomicrobiae bacterium]
MNNEKQPILLIEDDPNDVFFLKYAFETAGISNPLAVVEDGQEAIDYLQGKGAYTDRAKHPFPYLLLLDLKLPVKMGLDVLRWIHEQPDLATLLVVVLTSSRDKKDVDEAYRLGARSFLVKPLSVDERLEIAKAIKKYWLELNQAPSLCGVQSVV